MNLTIDIGNTNTKAALFEGDRMVDLWSNRFDKSPEALAVYVDTLCRHYPVERVTAAVVGQSPRWTDVLPAALLPHLHLVSSQSRLPFLVAYRTPETLGADRLAVVAGARRRYAEGPLLVIDAGSCITVDYVDGDNVYRGGAILPGVAMKLQMMHTLTARLPLLEVKSDAPLIGATTEECMMSGSVNASVLELEGYIGRLADEGGSMNVLMTGGDAATLLPKMCRKAERCEHLLMEGLNELGKMNQTTTQNT